jgi:hypothetical protein
VKQRIDNLGKNIDSVLNAENPAAAGTRFYYTCNIVVKIWFMVL